MHIQHNGKLAEKVYGLAKQQAGIVLKHAETFLCADTNTARQMFEKSHPASVPFRIAAPTGVEERPVEDISSELQQLLPAGKAWGPSVRKEEDLVTYYSINDTCWDYFGLRFVG